RRILCPLPVRGNSKQYQRTYPRSRWSHRRAARSTLRPIARPKGWFETCKRAPVAERVKHDLDLIIVINIFPARKASANLSRVIEAHEDDVKIFLVVSQVSRRRLGNRPPILRVALDETGDCLHFQGYFPTRLHAQKIL